MTTARLAHQIAMIPSTEQEQYFRKACGVARFAYNWGLSEWQKQYTTGEIPNWMALKKKLNSLKQDFFPWMYEVTKCAPEGALSNLGIAWSHYFRDLKKTGRKTQKPKFKKKGKSKDSFYLSNDQFKIQDKAIHLPHVGWIQLREALRFSGKILGATISRIADRWFISVQVETPVSHLKHKDLKSVGIDLGILSDITLSTGKKYQGPKALKKVLKKLARLNRSVHRKVKGSICRTQAALKLARLHRRVRNIRVDFIHKVTTQIVKKFGILCLEDLNVSGMLKNHKLARSIADVSFHEVKRQCEYKTELHGGKVLFVSRFFPSSKECRYCGTQNIYLSLKDRIFVCQQCLHQEDRDIHAARNILKNCTLGRRGIDAEGHQASIFLKSRKRFCRSKPDGLNSEKCKNTQNDLQTA